MLCEAPLVEGAVAAAVTAKLGKSLNAVAAEARSGLSSKVAHLGIQPEAGPSSLHVAAAPGEASVTAVIEVTIEHGLHARPAARFVQTAARFDAKVTVRNHTTDAGPADATSLNGVATLGVRAGHEIEVAASGPDATEAIAAMRALAARRFDEPPAEPATSASTSEGPASAEDHPLGRRGIEGTGAAGESGEPTAEGLLSGSGASPGIAVGELRRFHTPTLDIPDDVASDAVAELAGLETALRETAEAIANQRAAVAARAGEEEARIFDAHLLFLLDEALLEPARTAIRDGRRTAARAWRDAVDEVAAAWDTLDDEYLRARAIDLRSVGAQVLARHPRRRGARTAARRARHPGRGTTSRPPTLPASIRRPAWASSRRTVDRPPTRPCSRARWASRPSWAWVLARSRSRRGRSSWSMAPVAKCSSIPPPTCEHGSSPNAVREMSSWPGSVSAPMSRRRPSTARRSRSRRTSPVRARFPAPSQPAPTASGFSGPSSSSCDRDSLPDEHEQEAAYRAAAEALAGKAAARADPRRGRGQARGRARPGPRGESVPRGAWHPARPGAPGSACWRSSARSCAWPPITPCG